MTEPNDNGRSTGTALSPLTTPHDAGASYCRGAYAAYRAPAAPRQRRPAARPRPATPMATSPPTGSATRYGTPPATRPDWEQVRFHDISHAHASWLLAGGADLQVVKERLGHTNIATTRQVPAQPANCRRDRPRCPQPDP